MLYRYGYITGIPSHWQISFCLIAAIVCDIKNRICRNRSLFTWTVVTFHQRLELFRLILHTAVHRPRSKLFVCLSFATSYQFVYTRSSLRYCSFFWHIIILMGRGDDELVNCSLRVVTAVRTQGRTTKIMFVLGLLKYSEYSHAL